MTHAFYMCLPPLCEQNQKLDCTIAKASLKATVKLFNNISNGHLMHIYCMGNIDMIPNNRVTKSWLYELGEFLHAEGWLRQNELVTWKRGGFFRRRLDATSTSSTQEGSTGTTTTSTLPGVCVIVLNSNLWCPHATTESHDMVVSV